MRRDRVFACCGHPPDEAAQGWGSDQVGAAVAGPGGLSTERALVEALGATGLRDLIALHGGRRIYVARSATAKHLLHLPPLVAAALIEAFGGLTIEVPRGPSLHNARGKGISRARVLELRQRMTIERLAAEMECTPRTIRRKLKVGKVSSPPTCPPKPYRRVR